VRTRLLVAALAAITFGGCHRHEPERVYITIGADVAATAREVAHGVAIETLHDSDGSGDVAIVEIDAGDAQALSERLHEVTDRCGGYMVHDSLEDARAAVHALDEEHPDYTLDRPEIVNALLPKLDRERIHKTIADLSGMQNRYYQSKTGAEASRWLQARWQSFTKRSDVTVELFDHGYAQKSVILTIPGTTHPDEVIVIGGHLDSIAPGGKNSVAPGADDDASGTATVTEIARVLLENDFRPERTIKLMAYAAEEVGLRGSLAIAKDYKKRGVHVVGALQLDMTNYQGSDRDIWLIDDHTSKAQNAFLVQLIESYVGASWGWDRCGYACSDHASWHRYGVPASMPFEARFRDHNRSIHTKRDTLEMSDDNANHALTFARLGTAYAIELAKGSLGDGKALATRAADDDGGLPWRWLVLGVAAGAALFARRRR
jgi:leucyl aminopeptidase